MNFLHGVFLVLFIAVFEHQYKDGLFTQAAMIQGEKVTSGGAHAVKVETIKRTRHTNDDKTGSGSILSPNYILTRGALLHGASSANISKPGQSTIFVFLKYHIHSGYKPGVVLFDIGIIVLKEPLIFIPGVLGPINILGRGKPINSRTAVIHGYIKVGEFRNIKDEELRSFRTNIHPASNKNAVGLDCDGSDIKMTFDGGPVSSETNELIGIITVNGNKAYFSPIATYSEIYDFLENIPEEPPKKGGPLQTIRNTLCLN